jgi:hypothetical protein
MTRPRRGVHQVVMSHTARPATSRARPHPRGVVESAAMDRSVIASSDHEPFLDLTDTVEVTVLLPCLNEAETLGTCIDKAIGSLRALGVHGEILVADNGSTDGSREVATAHGARVVAVSTRGYGAALRGGIASARGRYVIMADADDSYDLGDLGPFLDALRSGADLVMGNRFAGGIEAGAMSRLHRIGNPILSHVGRRLFRIECRDLHCGMRGFRRDSVVRLRLRTTGMEFASEMVVRSALGGLQIAEVPTSLRRDGRTRAPHLRTWRDGWRHLRFLLLWSPRWLYLYPGLALLVLGSLGGAALTARPVSTVGVTFDVQSLLVCAVAVIVGAQLLVFGTAARSFGHALGLLPTTSGLAWLERRVTLERVVALGVLFLLVGLAGWVVALARWGQADFGALDARRQMRLVIPSATGIVVGLQLVFGGFLVALARSAPSEDPG